MDPVSPARSLKELCAQHFSETPVSSLASLQRRHSHPEKREERFFTFNTFLMDIPLGGRKPAVEYRDAEIGATIGERRYDIACLSEVWHKEERDDLLQSLGFAAELSHRSGSRGVNVVRIRSSAGLVTLTRNLHLIADHHHEYENESGQDANAAKACLLSVYETGYDAVNTPSSLNVYSTHMNYDGTAKYLQALELAHFIWRTKDKVQGNLGRPGKAGINANILCGDFNIDRWGKDGVQTADVARHAESMQLPEVLMHAIKNRVDEAGSVTDTAVAMKQGFQLLSDLLATLGFVDLWKHRNGTAGYTDGLMRRGVANVIARPARDDNTLCDDEIDSAALEALEAGAGAIDHIFVTPTTNTMPFTIDYTRPRRPRTVRAPDAPGYGDDGLTFMSDHLGLETTLLISPKSA